MQKLWGNCDKELITSICECALKRVARFHSYPEKEQEKIGKHKNDLRNIASKVVSNPKKKHIVQ